MLTKIGIGINREKDPDGQIEQHVREKIRSYFPDAHIFSSEINAESGEITEIPDMYFVLGGDGTFLGAARKLHGMKIPILGINLGTLGFLTSVELSDLDHALMMLKEKKYSIEKRNMIKVSFYDGGKPSEFIAMNDVVISKGSLGRMMKYEISVDRDYAASFRGDGVIFSTPTGSTAYNLSAGGPILYPTISAITMTAIAPHSLGIRNMVLNSSSKIRVRVSGDVESFNLSVDGQRNFNIDSGRYVEVVDSGAYSMVVRLDDYDYFDVLRKKIIYKAQDQ